MSISLVREFPAWHFSMLNDIDRNEKIAAALNNMEIKGKTVFEIGTGAGLAAMLFAQHGAKRIITCESNRQLYLTAKKIFNKNGLTSRIEAINKNSSDVIRDGDLDFEPDIIFTETLDCGIVGEGFNEIKKDILRVSHSKTTIIPEKIRQYGYLVESVDMKNLNHVTNQCGFDFSIINEYRTKSYFPVRAGLYKSMPLTTIFKLREISYDSPDNGDASIDISVHKGGVCHGIVSFFEADFDRYIVTNDIRSAGHWHQAFHPFEVPEKIRAGETCQISIDIQGTASMKIY